jgi:hypothetical protein
MGDFYSLSPLRPLRPLRLTPSCIQELHVISTGFLNTQLRSDARVNFHYKSLDIFVC